MNPTRGLPLGRRVDWRFSFCAMSWVHDSLPNGLPHRIGSAKADSSRVVCDGLTHCTQFAGGEPGSAEHEEQFIEPAEASQL